MALAASLAISLLLAFVAEPEVDEAGVLLDVRYIRCAACQHLLIALHAHAATARASAGAESRSLGEEDFAGMIDEACRPSTAAGKWLRTMDMVEVDTDGGSIELHPQPEDGPCGVECATVAMACRNVMEEGWDSERAVAPQPRARGIHPAPRISPRPRRRHAARQPSRAHLRSGGSALLERVQRRRRARGDRLRIMVKLMQTTATEARSEPSTWPAVRRVH